MPQDTWEAMRADALHPNGVQPGKIHAPKDYQQILRTLGETLQMTRKEGKRLWDITASPPPRTNIPSPPRKRRRTDTGSADTALTRSTQGTQRATQQEAPEHPAGGAPA